MLYTYFVFEFQTQAELQAYATLEYALREKFSRPIRKVGKGKSVKDVPLMLGGLLNRAIRENLFEPEKLPSLEWTNQQRKLNAARSGSQFIPLTGQEWLSLVLEHVKTLRDHLAHGNPHLDLPNSFSQIEVCADLINAIYAEGEK